jgi:putative endonuclease
MKDPCVYILASGVNGTLYVGVTSDLSNRMAEHTDGTIEGFTLKYGVKLLVYYEMHATMELAIKREKNIKEWKRLWKIRLIESLNPEWQNLYDRKTGAISFGSGDIEAKERRDEG